MNIKVTGILSLFLFCSINICSQNYKVNNIRGQRLEITSKYDNSPASEDAKAFLEPFKQKVDSFIGPVIGTSEQYMESKRPESLLSNWAADVLLQEAKNITKTNDIDFAVANMGGLRSSMPKGEIKRGDIINISPFQNTLVVLTLKGKDVLELFQQFGIWGGEGVSHGVRIVFNPDFTLKESLVNGKKIKKNKLYKIATLDYVAEGNDNMKAFKKATNTYNTGMFTRDAFINNIISHTKQGKSISSAIEGRITVLK